MYPTSCEYFEYVGHREATEDEKRRGREAREGFERCFLPPGVKLVPHSEMKE